MSSEGGDECLKQRRGFEADVIILTICWCFILDLIKASRPLMTLPFPKPKAGYFVRCSLCIIVCPSSQVTAGLGNVFISPRVPLQKEKRPLGSGLELWLTRTGVCPFGLPFLGPFLFFFW